MKGPKTKIVSRKDDEFYKYITKKCLELHHNLHHSQQEEKKYKNWKKEITELYLGNENTDVGTERKKHLC